MGTILLMGAGLQTTVTGPTYDPDAQLFFNAESSAGVTLTSTQMNAVNQWVVDAKAAGIWTKMKAIYPFVGGTATAHKFNLKNPADTNAAYRLVFTGGWTHSATGALPNGTNAYANTNLIPNSVPLLQNSTHFSFYSRTNTTGSWLLDVGGSTLLRAFIRYNDPSSNIYWSVNSAFYGASPTSNSSSLGFYTFNRTSSTTRDYFKNGVKTSAAQNSSGLSTANVLISGEPASFYYSNRECAFFSIGDGLTDAEAQLFYQITEKYQVALGRNINPTQSFYYNSAYNNETNAFLFSTQITDATIQTATNTLVNDLKTANIWTKMKAIYPMVGGTATTHKFNLVNSQDSNAAFRLVFNGGWTHSATGALPNGTNAYAQTYLTPSVSLGINNCHISHYSRTDNNTLSCDIGSQTSGNTPSLSMFAQSTYNVYRISDYTFSTVTTLTSKGFKLGTRLISTTKKMVANSLITDTLSSSTGIPNQSTIISAHQDNGAINYYSSRECAFASIGDGLTDADALAFYNAVQTFQTTLGRQV